MKFNILKKGDQVTTLARKIGYIPQKATNWDETAFIRPIERDFPRFHLYVKEAQDSFIFNLHLDQKKPTYGEQTAHSGEYNGSLVEGEAERIKTILTSLREKKIENSNKPEMAKEKTGSKLTDLFKNLFGK